MFEFASGDKYIGKGEIGRMISSIAERTLQVQKMNKEATIIGSAHMSTGGDNTLGKMVEYKAMHDAGFVSGRGGVPNGYLNSFLSGKSTWDAHPELQEKATQLANQLKNDYEADVQTRATQKRNQERNQNTKH